MESNVLNPYITSLHPLSVLTISVALNSLKVPNLIAIKVHRFMKKVDLNKSKTVDASELMIALKDTSIKREDVLKFIFRYDINKDGELDKRELKIFFKEQGL
ncbi:hypothetical protein ACTXT7_005354 [Hymenolepis weldensis]